MEVLGAVFQHQPWEMSQPKGIFLDSCEEGPRNPKLVFTLGRDKKDISLLS